MTAAIASLLATALGATAGYLLGRTRLSLLAQDGLAVFAGIAFAAAILFGRIVVYFMTAAKTHGIAAVGFDPRMSFLLVAGVAAILVVLFHFGLQNMGASLAELRPALIGGLTGAVGGWVLCGGYWQAT